jgi:hypothetical protein
MKHLAPLFLLFLTGFGPPTLQPLPPLAPHVPRVYTLEESVASMDRAIPESVGLNEDGWILYKAGEYEVDGVRIRINSKGLQSEIPQRYSTDPAGNKQKVAYAKLQPRWLERDAIGRLTVRSVQYDCRPCGGSRVLRTSSGVTVGGVLQRK